MKLGKVVYHLLGLRKLADGTHGHGECHQASGDARGPDFSTRGSCHGWQRFTKLDFCHAKKHEVPMQRLLRALVDFKAAPLDPKLQALFGTLADGQKPEVLLVTCADSRVVPHLFAGAEPGHLFVVRTVGNLVAPADEHGLAKGDVSEASAIEYALEVLGIRDIAVCGHSNCGAMKATLDGRQRLASMAPNLAAWLEHAEASLTRQDTTEKGLSPINALAQRNVLQQLAHIATYPSVKKRRNEVRLHALYFDIGPARVSLYEGEPRGFVPLDEAEVGRLLATNS
jgi:carbonic anhydrase